MKWAEIGFPKGFINRRATREDRGGDGLHQPGHEDRRAGAQGDGALLRDIPQVLEKVRK